MKKTPILLAVTLLVPSVLRVGVAHANPQLDAQLLAAQAKAISVVEKEALGSKDVELAESLARLGRLDSALKVLQSRSADLSPRVRNLLQQSFLGFAARRHAVLDERVQAVALLPRITHPFVRADVCLALARSNMRSKNFGPAANWINQATTSIAQAEKDKTKGQKFLDNGFYYGVRHAAVLKAEIKANASTSSPSMAARLSSNPNSNSWVVGQLIMLNLGEGKVEQAVQLASIKLKYGNQLLSWATLAQYFLGRGQKERARAMIGKLESQIPDAQKQAKTEDDRAVLSSAYATLADAYRALGNTANANRWFAVASKNLSPARKLRLSLGFELAPLILIEGRSLPQDGFSLLSTRKPSPLIPSAQRQNIDAAVRRLWPRLGKVERFNALLVVCASQLDANERVSAKNTLEFLEKAYPSIPEEETNQFPLLQVASGWRRLGEEARVQKLVAPYIASLEAEDSSLSIVQSDLETYGFINEAVALYDKHSGGDSPTIYNDWPYRVIPMAARFQRSAEFPDWIASIKSVEARRLSIGLYVKEITKPFFDSPQEPDLSLQVGPLYS